MPNTLGEAINKGSVRVLLATCFVQCTLIPSPVDILFPSNHNIHKSSYDLCFWASDPLLERF